MVKVSRVVTTLVLGAAGGAAAAIFLASKTGKAVKEKVLSAAKDYQENHEEINADLLRKAQGLKEEAIDKYQEVKDQLESGELTYEDLVASGREKALTLKERSLERLEQVKERLAAQEIASTDFLVEDDIIVEDVIEIDLH